MSTSDRRNDQYLRNVRHGMRERENGWFAQDSDLPLSELPNHFRPYRKLVTIDSELNGFQRKFG